MRPPYGATNAAVAAVVAQTGLKQVMWTVDPQDWAHRDANYIAGHVLSHVRDRSIVLMHDGAVARGDDFGSEGHDPAAQTPGLRVQDGPRLSGAAGRNRDRRVGTG